MDIKYIIEHAWDLPKGYKILPGLTHTGYSDYAIETEGFVINGKRINLIHTFSAYTPKWQVIDTWQIFPLLAYPKSIGCKLDELLIDVCTDVLAGIYDDAFDLGAQKENICEIMNQLTCEIMNQLSRN